MYSFQTFYVTSNSINIVIINDFYYLYIYIFTIISLQLYIKLFKLITGCFFKIFRDFFFVIRK